MQGGTHPSISAWEESCVNYCIGYGGFDFSSCHVIFNLVSCDPLYLSPQQPLSLCLAVQSGDLDSVERILVDLESQSEGREGEGMEAVREDGQRVVDQRNEQSHAPLHLACTAGNM